MSQIIANMATFPPREAVLPASIQRLEKQVDQINLCLNEYSEIPRWISQFKKVNAIIPITDKKDLGKFVFDCNDSDDVFMVDDDIPYPKDYVSRTIDQRDALAQKLSQDFVVGYHGTYYERPHPLRVVYNYVLTKNSLAEQIFLNRAVFGYHTGLGEAISVSQLGTGTVLLKGFQLPDPDFLKGSERRVDVRFAQWCQAHSILRVCLSREAGWLAHGGDDDDSIWRTYTSQKPKEILSEVTSIATRGRNLHLPAP